MCSINARADRTFVVLAYGALMFALQWRLTMCHGDIQVFEMSDFPKSIVALHMPCNESNVFATKCAVSTKYAGDVIP
jgi:hypothetical protein